jgi:RNA polymerase sigma factor (sigma-70 family)
MEDVTLRPTPVPGRGVSGAQIDFLQRRPCSFRIWIRRKALERLVDQRRRHVDAEKRSVRRERQISNSSLAIARKLVTDSPSKILRKNELQKQIRNVIDGLREKDREILTLRHAEGLSNAEVADLLKINPNSARQRYGRALRRLHEQLVAQGIGIHGVWE